MKGPTYLGLVLLLTQVILAQPVVGQPVYVVTLKDAFVNQALADYLKRSIEKAEQDRAQCLIIRITTPGGMLEAMQEVVRLFLNSRVPIVVFVWPRGGNADSAGAFIVMAAHIAAMAPASRIGAAHPVLVSPTGTEGPPTEMQKIMMEKATNAVVGTIRAIAEERKRNTKWAEKMVRQSAVLTANEAVQEKVIDLVAEDLTDLLRQLDGRRVRTAAGVATLRTSGTVVEEITMTPKESFLHFLSNPNVTLLLLFIAVLGFVLEVYNPGAVLPITVAIIAFLLFLYSAMLIPVNVVGVLLILAAAAFFVAELFVASHGVLAIAGLISLILGGYFLIPEPGPGQPFYAGYFRVSPATLVGLGIMVGAILGGAIVAIVRSQRRKPAFGREGLIGSFGEARTDLSPSGTVFISGTWWTADAVDGEIKAGEKVEVVDIEGLRLKVRRKT
ncbi:MAG: nodulation protein NfeD [Armatimonadetes bacterium]|nr:nodulation protein NfeD [Armatimonadota bacterium]MDW8121475.1 nodulation protein NfeD [Armatimonadota bacterium]